MVAGVSIPTEDRILLYLLNFGSLDDIYEADTGLTQKGISINVRVQRKHISRYLNKLIEDAMVEECVRHVKGAKQKMRCYCLTGQGVKRAKEIQKIVGNKVVKVRIDDEVKNMKISEIDGATSVHLRFSDIVCEALETHDILDMKTLESIEENRRRMIDEKTMKSEVYKQALAVAWRSGVLTTSEKHLIDALKTHLAISDEDHKHMETKIINDIPPLRATHVDLYDEILNLIGGKPTTREENILELLKDRLNKD
ncbi:MAG: hypothetical protein Q7J68_01910 [Thermoplasmata archaeon]|nr:hypothetical protein [Thermoplasmata archaeon]